MASSFLTPSSREVNSPRQKGGKQPCNLFFGEGLFELNPPFCADAYTAVAKACDELLSRAEDQGRALSFCIIVGATPNALGDAAEATEASKSAGVVVGLPPPPLAPLMQSRFLRLPDISKSQNTRVTRLSLMVSVAEHSYISGHQHIKGGTAKFRACDTGIFFLQTTAGAVKWPVTAEGCRDCEKRC
jgi:phosphorylated CTD-interacting factor 1